MEASGSAEGTPGGAARLDIGDVHYQATTDGSGDGSLGATDMGNFEAEFEQKRLHLAKLEEEVRVMRLELTAKEEEIQEIREELGLTPLAQFRQAVTSSAPYQKTKEIGDRMTNSEAFKKTQSTLNDVGNKTGELLKTAGAKTSDAFSQASQSIQESETLNEIGAKFRQATSKIKSTFSKEPVDDTQEVSTPGLVEDIPVDKSQH